MLNTNNHLEYIFYMLLRDIQEKDCNVSICFECFQKDEEPQGCLSGYGAYDYIKDESFWKRFCFTGTCTECNQKKEIAYLPFLIIIEGLRDMLTREAYSEFEKEFTLSTKEDALEYLKKYKKLLDEAGKHESREYKDLVYRLPIVRERSVKNSEEHHYDFIGITQGALWRYLMLGFTAHSTNVTSVLSSVSNAFIASHCIPYGTDSFPFFMKKISDLDVLGITNEQYIRAEARAMFDKMHYQMDADEIDFEPLLSSTSLDKVDFYLDEAYNNSDDGEKYADTLFEYLENREDQYDLSNIFGYIITDNWMITAEVSFDDASFKRFIALCDDDSTYLFLKWVSEATKNLQN